MRDAFEAIEKYDGRKGQKFSAYRKVKSEPCKRGSDFTFSVVLQYELIYLFMLLPKIS